MSPADKLAAEQARMEAAVQASQRNEGMALTWPWKNVSEPKRRSRMRKAPRFKVGDVVRDQVMMFRGVVAGWDAPCEGPAWWRSWRLVLSEWADEPCYGLLVDLRDVQELTGGGEPLAPNEMRWYNLTQYAPERSLEKLPHQATLGAPLISPLLPQNFRFFDAGRYVPEEKLARSYPDDVPRFFSALDEVDNGPEGRPLLRVSEHGRLIAHGAPVPVIHRGMFIVASESVQGDMFANSVVLILEHKDRERTLGVIANLRHPAGRGLHLLEGRQALAGMEQTLENLAGAPQKQPDVEQRVVDVVERGRWLLRLCELPNVDLRIGGPVDLQRFPLGLGHVIIHPLRQPAWLRKASKLAISGSGMPGDPDLYYVEVGKLSKEQLEKLLPLVEKTSMNGHVVVFAGVSAWGPLQLAGEIRGGLDGGKSWGWVPATPREVLSADGRKAWAALNASKAVQWLEAE